MSSIDYAVLRASIVSGSTQIRVTPLDPAAIDDIAWSGGRSHLENVASQLQRVDTGEVEYLAVRADGHAVSKGGIDFAKESDAGTIWQVATHPQLEGIGLATLLIHALESRALERGVSRIRLGVELDNGRARRLYEHLGYRVIGESETSWEAETADGSRFLHTTTLAEMLKVVERIPSHPPIGPGRYASVRDQPSEQGPRDRRSPSRGSPVLGGDGSAPSAGAWKR